MHRDHITFRNNSSEAIVSSPDKTAPFIVGGTVYETVCSICSYKRVEFVTTDGKGYRLVSDSRAYPQRLADGRFAISLPDGVLAEVDPERISAFCKAQFTRN